MQKYGVWYGLFDAKSCFESPAFFQYLCLWSKYRFICSSMSPYFLCQVFLVKLECSWLLASTGPESQPSFSTTFLDAGQNIDCRMHILILLDKVQSPNQQPGYICAIYGIHDTNIRIELFCSSSCSDPRLLEDVFGWQLILEWIIVMHWGLSPDQVPPTVVQPKVASNFTWKTIRLVFCLVILKGLQSVS